MGGVRKRVEGRDCFHSLPHLYTCHRALVKRESDKSQRSNGSKSNRTKGASFALYTEQSGGKKVTQKERGGWQELTGNEENERMC